MLVVMRQDATADEIRGVVEAVEARGYKAHPIPGAHRTAIGITGNKGADEAPVFETLPGVLEVIPVTHAYKLVSRYAAAIQIGARNMQNFSLLKRAGRARKPVVLKRGMSATLEEFLMSAEYILAEGNYQVILCERGVRTFSDHSRNTLDLAVV